MSTSYGEFRDKRDQMFYWNGSQMRNEVELCMGDDTNSIMRLTPEEGMKALRQLEMALFHIGVGV